MLTNSSSELTPEKVRRFGSGTWRKTAVNGETATQLGVLCGNFVSAECQVPTGQNRCGVEVWEYDFDGTGGEIQVVCSGWGAGRGVRRFENFSGNLHLGRWSNPTYGAFSTY